MVWWKTVYSGPSSKVQQQITTILHREGIPFRCHSAGFSLHAEKENYRVSVRSGDLALAVLVLKKYRAKK